MAMEINKLLQTVVSQGASDLHLAVNKPPLIRIDGKLVGLHVRVSGQSINATLNQAAIVNGPSGGMCKLLPALKPP